jgi:putative membrane protein
MAAWLGVAFILLGVVLNIVSIIHYRRAIATLRPVEIPPRYWPNLASLTSLGVAVLGVLLAFYIVKTL